MSKCGYFKIVKGKPICTHPTYSEEYNGWSNNLSHRCDMCRRECGGIYPSQVPRADQTGWKYEVIATLKGCSVLEPVKYVNILKEWTEGENVLYERKE